MSNKHSYKNPSKTQDLGHVEAQEEKEDSGVGFVSDEAKELNVKVYKDQVDKLIKEYKRIKKFKKSNLGQVQNLGLVDKHGKPL